MTPLETKIWSWSLAAPSTSCQAIHGTGALPATVAPPASDGFSASRLVWMFTDGTLKPAERSWPSGIHTLAVESKRLAKMFLTPPRWTLGSYHETHGTVRPGPAKSIDGASASWLESMFSEAGKPWVVHLPPLKARTKICCEAPVFCSNVAHGTLTPPAASEPPTTSETPAGWSGGCCWPGRH